MGKVSSGSWMVQSYQEPWLGGAVSVNLERVLEDGWAHDVSNLNPYSSTGSHSGHSVSTRVQMWFVPRGLTC